MEYEFQEESCSQVWQHFLLAAGRLHLSPICDPSCGLEEEHTAPNYSSMEFVLVSPIA